MRLCEGESGRRGSAAVYRVNALNLPLSETNLFIPELSVERESVTPIAVAKAKNAVAIARMVLLKQTMLLLKQRIAIRIATAL